MPVTPLGRVGGEWRDLSLDLPGLGPLGNPKVHSVCRLSQDCASPPKWRASRVAASAVIPLRLRTMSLMRGAGTRRAFASALAVRPEGRRKSSRNTSPDEQGALHS